MGKDTKISWADHTFNPWWGCTEVSPGCARCYAKTFDKRTGGEHWGKGAPRRTFGDEHWAEPLEWNSNARAAGEMVTAFCASMADVMDAEAPGGQRWRLWELIDATPYIMWLLLTKRVGNFTTYLPAQGFMHDNVRLGATTENQPMYDSRMPVLLEAARWLHQANVNGSKPWKRDRQPVQTFASYEPALGPVTLEGRPVPDQIIFGGETGAGHRTMNVGWAINMRNECRVRNVAFFMKQMSGANPQAAADLIPAELLIRQFPARTDGN
jgi:protein gp37